jgi:hypothetical protein
MSGALRTAALRQFNCSSAVLLSISASRRSPAAPSTMWPRYALANDLSALLASTPRVSQFRPFMPHRLDVHFCSSASGTLLRQYDDNDSVVQKFSFEDVREGFVYIRTHRQPVHHCTDLAGRNPGRAMAHRWHGRSGPHPVAQRWLLANSGISALNHSDLTIINAEVSGKVLPPAGGSSSGGVAVVLRAPNVRSATTFDPWQVTGPLLPTRRAPSACPSPNAGATRSKRPRTTHIEYQRRRPNAINVGGCRSRVRHYPAAPNDGDRVGCTSDGQFPPRASAFAAQRLA